MSLFAAAELAPRDPILGLNEQFNADPNPDKVNLGVGVYHDDDGKLPLLKCVAAAQKQLLAAEKPKSYLPITGLAAYDTAVKHLVFGAESEAVKSGRIATVQALGGTGALKVGADFLKTLYGGSKVLVSNPSWQNHRAIFTHAGFEVGNYPYYAAERHGIDFEAMIAALEAAPKHTILVLHACCHNPTGYDLTPAQWDQVVAAVKKNELIAFLDMAYQGFGEGIAEDGAVVGKFVAAGLDFLIATSYSKSFSMYGERVGALSVACANQDEAERVLSQLKIVIRTNYSNPPTFGAQIVATVLSTPELRALWENELAEMRARIKTMRATLVEKLTAAGVQRDMSFITGQKGMFSFSGLTKEQMQRLRSEFGIYGVDSGRICVAALNTQNVDYVARSIATVL